MQMHDQQKFRGIRAKLLHWLGLTTDVTIKVYHGYGHTNQFVLYGHVFKLSPKPRRKYRRSFLRNTWALLRLFMVKPFPYITVRLLWQDRSFETKAGNDGFFKFDWKDAAPPAKGWHQVTVHAISNAECIAEAAGHVYVPFFTQYGFISDIDDTFLVSYSSNLRKRLFVLFTENARTRKPFEDVATHYRLLAEARTTTAAPNPFFYVSSSEWNLYEYILEFTNVNNIPPGVFLLNQLKQFSELLKTGQNHHRTKFIRIARILESYPDQRFVLLGDSSQQDPYIYEALVAHFPKQIHAVYIRDVYAANKKKTADVLYKIESKGVPCCFFTSSSEAILHSQRIGLIDKTTLA